MINIRIGLSQCLSAVGLDSPFDPGYCLILVFFASSDQNGVPAPSALDTRFKRHVAIELNPRKLKVFRQMNEATSTNPFMMHTEPATCNNIRIEFLFETLNFERYERIGGACTIHPMMSLRLYAHQYQFR